MKTGLAGRDQFENDHSVVAAGAVDDAVDAGEICTGAAGVRFGAGGFLAAARAGGAAATVAAVGGRGAGTGASWTGAAAARPAAGVGTLPGSGVMMLTGGVEAADGKSALVGLPVGTEGGSAATSPGAAGGGAFQEAE
jgi:hypothetical protein